MPAPSGFKRRRTPKERLFLDLYFGKSDFNATQAARDAGYRWPESVGSKLCARLKDEIDARYEELRASAVMTPEECMKHLADIGRNGAEQNRLRAIELQLKIHGMLSEKLSVTLDRKALLTELEQQVARLTSAALSRMALPGGDVVDVESTTPPES